MKNRIGRKFVITVWVLSIHQALMVSGDNLRKSSFSGSNRGKDVNTRTGFENFEPFQNHNQGTRLSSNPEAQHISVVGKHYASSDMRMSTLLSTRTRSGLEKGRIASRDQKDALSSSQTKKQNARKSQRKVEVRNLTFQTCGGGGTQFVVECVVGSEKHCHQELVKAGAVIVNELPNSDFFAVCVDTDDELELLKSLTDLADMEEDHTRSLSYLPELTKPVDHRQMQAQGQQIPYGVEMVNAPQFWQSKENRGSSVKVCIIDTGLYVGHEDMQGAAVSGSTDNNVVSDWDSDDAGHGTHVAGTIAAVDNNVGVVGVAPEVELLIVRVFEGATSQFAASSLVAAMSECAKEGADIINLSLGGASSSAVERSKVDELTNQGIQLIAASGNSGDTSNPEEYPASYDNVISVGAVGSNREIASFSTHNDEVDVSAPGLDILSLTQSCSSCYSLFSGTSMASPHVAGVFALLMSEYPDKSISQIREAIEESASDTGACGVDRMYGHGVIDVIAAASYLDNESTASELNGCIDTKVTVRTDEGGQEMFYVIRNSGGEVVYKNGPYSSQIETYIDEFQLPDDCYEFEMLDSYGDGICFEEGSGYFKVEFNGVEEVSNNSFTDGNSVRASFGCTSGGGGGTGSGGGGSDSTPVCGNGVVENGEECDDGNQNDNDSCTNQCTIAVCGDGIVGPEEQCDDGNTIDNDDCRNDCTSGACGDGIVQSALGEECDDGNDIDTDLCTKACNSAKCGDGFKQPGEECDDGNRLNGDGCSSDCKVESISTSCEVGEASVKLSLQADAYSYNENELYFFEAKGQTDVEDIDFIWIGTQQGIENNKKYELSECVDESKCYRFYFFDAFGDGLRGSDGFSLSWNGDEVLSVAPYEVGTQWEGGPTVYWMKDVGIC